MNDRAGPRSATELQAVITLRAARDVAETIESLRHALRGGELTRSRRQRLKNDLLEAAERLCNLLDLLMSWLATVSDGVREPLAEGIAELRGKLLATGVKLIGDRLKRINEKAIAITTGVEGFPLGISMRLGESMATLMATINALGGRDMMPPEILAKLGEPDRLLMALRDQEEELGFGRELHGDRP